MFVSDFESENRSFNTRKSTTAVITTVVIHGLILLFLIFTILHTPDPPFEDNAGGMAVNFGTDDVGMGDEQPFTYTPGEAATTPAAASKSQPQATTPDELLSSDEESDVTTTKTDKPKTKVDNEALLKPTTKPNTNPTTPNKNKPVDNTPPTPQANPDALFGSKGAKGAPKNGSDGTGDRPGDQGNPNGDVNSHNYEGDPGPGNKPGSGGLGSGFSLKGRTRVTLPAPIQCNTQGKVVIGIKVNKDGKVTETKFKRFESTAFDDCNVNNALNAAKKATFNPDPNAPEVQEGTITYIYKVN